MARVWFAEALREAEGMTAETAVEAFYKIQLRPWASLQPDLQYIANPMGNGRDALLAGLRYELAL